MSIILNSLYFFLPAYLANMMPFFFRKLQLLNQPVSEKVFGKNKTWRGLLVATLTGGLVFWLQKLAYVSGFRSLAIIDYADFSISLGFLLGFGAIIGDLVKSYYKRKVGFKPGESWFMFDQLDFVIGALLFSFFVYVLPAEVFFTIIIGSPFLHILVNYLGYLLGIRKQKI